MESKASEIVKPEVQDYNRRSTSFSDTRTDLSVLRLVSQTLHSIACGRSRVETFELARKVAVSSDFIDISTHKAISNWHRSLASSGAPVKGSYNRLILGRVRVIVIPCLIIPEVEAQCKI